MQNDYVVVAKSHANLLVESLKKQGITLKKAQALEIISSLHNRTDWNRLQSKLKGLSKPGSNTKPTTINTYDAFLIDGYSSKGVPLETLRSLFELECADGETSPVMIAVAGDGHTYNGRIDDYFNSRERLTITYDADGVVEIFHSGYSKSGLLINLVPEKRGARHGAGLALAQFLNNTGHKYSLDFRQRIGTLMISDFGQFEEVELDGIFAAINGFALRKVNTFRRFIATTHNYKIMDYLNSIGMNAQRISYQDPAYQPSSMDTSYHFQFVRATSLEDRTIVTDTLNWLKTIAMSSLEDRFGSGESRAKKIPGNSLWFRDLRASLLDDSSRT
ncbi:glyoxalase superfamily protein [Pseudomonas serbica]|uniref:glyoxalase superfamily protein n=1 Tax=Pseudomonas serbica TaxID=2965074 RepID=UPI00237C1C1A|nr:glyoxalase superfamily protein [Pseudomonas serbica]